MTEPRPEGFTILNERLDPAAVEKVDCPTDYMCRECSERGFIPSVWAEDCPECYGGDEYGQPRYCAECEFCCGC